MNYGYGVLALALPGLWIAWHTSRRIVRLGFYVIYSIVGAGLTLGVCLYQRREPTVPIVLAGGIGFASLVMAIRSKIMRLVGLLAVGAALYLYFVKQLST